MHVEVIRGVVVSGRGGASRAMVGERLRDRSEVAGEILVPGTLNVLLVEGTAAALEALGDPLLSTEHNARVGPLRWWPVSVSVGGLSGVEAWIVRHERTVTRYLEIVSAVGFRAAGVCDGAVVEITPR